MADEKPLLRRRVTGPVPGQSLIVAQPKYHCSTLSRFPTLLAFLTQIWWDKQTARQTGTLTLFAEDGKLKVCLVDRDVDEVAFVTGQGLPEVLEALEEGLSAGGLDWRKKKGGYAGRGR